MAEEKQQQEGQKTVTSFVVGLLIGGLLVWTFSGPTEDNSKDKNKENKEEKVKVEDKKDGEKEDTSEKTEETTKVEEKKTETKEENKTSSDNSASVIKSLSVGDGKIKVEDQTVGKSVKLSSATYPVSEGWVGVRDYQNEKLGGILGVVRFSEAQGLVPSEIILQRPTVAGKDYAVVVFSEDGDRIFNLAGDKQMDKIFATFKAK